MYPGADEAGLTLLSYCLNDYYKTSLKTHVIFASEKGRSAIPNFEDSPVEKTILCHIKACGLTYVTNYEEADLLLFVNNGDFFIDGYYEDIENFNASNNIDLLHAPVAVDNQNGQSTSPVTMNFNHILTNVNVELKKQEEQEIKIVKAAIKLPTVGDYSWSGTNSIKWSVDDEIPAKTLTFDYSAESKTLFNDQYTPIIENLLCIPQEITANAITLRFDYSFSFKPESSAVITENREYYVTLPAGTWNPGDKVVYRGIIDAHMNIVFGAPTVEEWGEDMAGGTIIIK